MIPNGVEAGLGIMQEGINCPQNAFASSFVLNLQNSIIPSVALGGSTLNFSRASGATLSDFEGLVHTDIQSGEVRFGGARRVRNLSLGNSDTLSSGQNTTGGTTFTAFSSGGMVGNAYTQVTTGSGTLSSSIVGQSIGFVAGHSYRVSFDVQYVGGAAKSTINVVLNDGSNFLPMTTSWQRISVIITSAGGEQLRIDRSPTANAIYNIGRLQIEDVTGLSNQNPSEYVNTGVLSAPYHGANVDGVQYFSYFNQNTVDSSGIVSASSPLVPITSATAKFGINTYNSGDYFSTPSSSNLNPTGDMSLVADIAPESWTPAITNVIVNKDAISATTRSWSASIQTNGAIRFSYSLDGTNIISITSSVATGFAAGTRHKILIEREAATGYVRFYTSDDRVTWTLLGTQQSGTAGAIYASTTQINFGNLTGSSLVFNGRFYDNELWWGLLNTNSAGATLKMDFDPSDWTSGSTWTSADSGETWTINGNAKVYVDSWDILGGYGYLSEEQSTNLLLNSNNTSLWTSSGSPTITVTNPTAPDGTSTLNLWTRTTTASSATNQSITKAASSLPYVFSIYAKQATVGNTIALRIQGNYPDRTDVAVNLATGVAGVPLNSGTGFTGSVQVIPLPNGIYRILFATSGTDTSGLTVYYSFNSNGSNQVDTMDSVSNSNGYVWGGQLEQASLWSSLIPTAGSTATRLADVMYYSNISGWFNAQAGAVVGQFVPQYNGAYQQLFSFDDNTYNNRISLAYFGPYQTQFDGVTSGTAWVYQLTGALPAIGVISTFATSWSATSPLASIAVNGTVTKGIGIGTGVFVAPAGVTHLCIANRNQSEAFFQGNCRFIKVYASRPTDTNLALLT